MDKNEHIIHDPIEIESDDDDPFLEKTMKKQETAKSTNNKK